MKVRYVAMVPIEFEEDVYGDDDFVTQWGREYLSVNHAEVESKHRRRDFPYEPMLVEAVRLDEGGEVDLEEMIAPGGMAA